MDQMDGMKLITEVHKINPVVPIIMMSGSAAIKHACQATHLGVADFLEKPITRNLLYETVKKTIDLFRSKSFSSVDTFAPSVIYRSKVMTELLRRAKLVADGDSSVFIAGNTGTGKELIAEAIHQGSRRKEQPFIAINCSALPEQLLESELFGHVKGAFTGAHSNYPGLFQSANNGTLFLDEIGDMPTSIQVKLLRVLQEFKVRPVGSPQSIPVDVRIISATHQDLEQMVTDGHFREDLYYRLNVVPLNIPPLSERREDIPLLINHFLNRLSQRQHNEVKKFAPESMELLLSSSWPGNVRQLQNVIEQCYVLSSDSNITPMLVSEALRRQNEEMPSLDTAKQAFEQRYLASLLRITNGNITNTAKLAGRNRTELYRLLSKHGLEPEKFRESE
jgi:two-component system response regulator GlrR